MNSMRSNSLPVAVTLFASAMLFVFDASASLSDRRGRGSRRDRF